MLRWELHGYSDLLNRVLMNENFVPSFLNSVGLTGFAGIGLIFSSVTGFGCSTTVVVVVVVGAIPGAAMLGCIDVVTGCSWTVFGI